MIAIITILYAIAGWLAGVAINHAADILPTRIALLRRPACQNCQAVYRTRQWSALLAWISRAPVCRHCGQRRPSLARSVVVELATPLFFVFLLGRFGLSWYLGLVTLYTVILILITVTDLEHRLIFNIVTMPAILLAVVAAFVTPEVSWRAALLGGAVGFALTYIAWLLGALFYGAGALGAGDITLATFLGLILGFPHILLGLVYGVFLGGFVALLLVITRRRGRKSFIPYGPFLTITGWIMLVWGNQVWQYTL